jgi:hypothetical protein
MPVSPSCRRTRPLPFSQVSERQQLLSQVPLPHHRHLTCAAVPHLHPASLTPRAEKDFQKGFRVFTTAFICSHRASASAVIPRCIHKKLSRKNGCYTSAVMALNILFAVPLNPQDDPVSLLCVRALSRHAEPQLPNTVSLSYLCALVMSTYLVLPSLVCGCVFLCVPLPPPPFPSPLSTCLVLYLSVSFSLFLSLVPPPMPHR